MGKKVELPNAQIGTARSRRPMHPSPAASGERHDPQKQQSSEHRLNAVRTATKIGYDWAPRGRSFLTGKEQERVGGGGEALLFQLLHHWD